MAMQSVYLIRGLTDECQGWIEANLQHEKLFDGGVPVETRFMEDIFHGMQERHFEEGKDLKS